MASIRKTAICLLVEVWMITHLERGGGLILLLEFALSRAGNASGDTAPDDVLGLDSRTSSRIADMSGRSSEDPLNFDGR